MATYDNQREYVPTVEAAKLAEVTQNYLALLLRQGKLEGFRPAHDWFVFVDSLEQFIASPHRRKRKSC